ncbi:MAG: hypothetical protein AAF829_14105 [Pseudomonadota bacterium]
MRKQIVAAIASVLLPFVLWLVVFLPTLATVFVTGEGDPELVSSALTVPFLMAFAASVCSLLALIYLKLHYGTMALLGMAAAGTGMAGFFYAPVAAGLLGLLSAAILAGGIIAGLWYLLKWVYADTAPQNVVEEF